MASSVRLSIAVIACVQLALGNLPAWLHHSACSCNDSATLVAKAGLIGGNFGSVSRCAAAGCEGHRHTSKTLELEECSEAADSEPPADPHDSEDCPICQFLMAQFTHALVLGIANPPTRLNEEPWSSATRLAAKRDLSLPVPRGPPC